MRCLGSPRRAEDGEGIAPRGISPVVSGSLGKPVKLRPASWSWGGRPSRHLSRLLGLSRAGSRSSCRAFLARRCRARGRRGCARRIASVDAAVPGAHNLSTLFLIVQSKCFECSSPNCELGRISRSDFSMPKPAHCTYSIHAFPFVCVLYTRCICILCKL